MELSSHTIWIKSSLLIIIYLNRLSSCEEVFQILEREKFAQNSDPKPLSDPNKYDDYLRSIYPLYYAPVGDGANREIKFQKYYYSSLQENKFLNFSSNLEKPNQRPKKKTSLGKDRIFFGQNGDYFFPHRSKKSAYNSYSEPEFDRTETKARKTQTSFSKNLTTGRGGGGHVAGGASSEILANRFISFSSSPSPPTRGSLYLGSIHKESYERIINESLTIIGSTSSSGRISATEPYIDPATPDRINAYSGNTVILPCFVNNLGQHSVSWVRHRDIHVLTVGRLTFTNDARFLSYHEDGSNEWALSLSSPNMNDTGLYECQVNTKPIITRLIRLKVYEPRAIISGGQELYIKLGSTISLLCRVVNAPSASEFLLWYHNQKVANYGDGRLQINTTQDSNETISILTVTAASPRDSGTYTCNPSNAKDAAVKVHVINGEHPAAMQTNSAIENRIHRIGLQSATLFGNIYIFSPLRKFNSLFLITSINVILLYVT